MELVNTCDGKKPSQKPVFAVEQVYVTVVCGCGFNALDDAFASFSI